MATSINNRRCISGLGQISNIQNPQSRIVNRANIAQIADIKMRVFTPVNTINQKILNATAFLVISSLTTPVRRRNQSNVGALVVNSSLSNYRLRVNQIIIGALAIISSCLVRNKKSVVGSGVLSIVGSNSVYAKRFILSVGNLVITSNVTLFNPPSNHLITSYLFNLNIQLKELFNLNVSLTRMFGLNISLGKTSKLNITNKG